MHDIYLYVSLWSDLPLLHVNNSLAGFKWRHFAVQLTVDCMLKGWKWILKVWALHKQHMFVFGRLHICMSEEGKLKVSPCVQEKLCCCHTVSETFKHAQSEDTRSSFTAVPSSDVRDSSRTRESLPSKQSKHRNWDLLAEGMNVRERVQKVEKVISAAFQLPGRFRKSLQKTRNVGSWFIWSYDFSETHTLLQKSL